MKPITWDLNKVIRTIISLAVIIALFLLIRRLSGVLLPFLVSLVIAYVLAPIVNFFQKKCRIRNRVLAVVMTLILTIAVLAGAVAALATPISRQVAALSRDVHHYVANFDPSSVFAPEWGEQLLAMMKNLDIQQLLQNDETRQVITSILQKMGVWIGNGISALTGLTIVFICLLYIIFLLIDFEKIEAHWQDYLPAKYRTRIVLLVNDLERSMNAYFRGQALIALCVGILFATGFQLIGLPLGIVMGIIVGILNLIPYMQALGIPPCILLALLQASETGRPVWLCLLLLALVFILVQTIQDMLLTPKIMGGVTGMGPAWILLALSIWGSLLGLVGMIIALPITSLLISYYKRFLIQQDNTTNTPAATYESNQTDTSATNQ